ncbi:MAG: hypothetical protein ACLR23_15635 [Clostridia bacterium]
MTAGRNGGRAPVLTWWRCQTKTLFGVGFSNVAIGHFDPSKQKKIPYLMKIMRAESMDALLSGDIQVSFAQVEIPDLAVGYGDSQDPKEYHTGVTGQTVIVMPNGDLIVPMYGQFKADTTKLSYFQNYDFYQYRVWCVISRDNGRSFSYLSTVADVQTYPVIRKRRGTVSPICSIWETVISSVSCGLRGTKCIRHCTPPTPMTVVSHGSRRKRFVLTAYCRGSCGFLTGGSFVLPANGEPSSSHRRMRAEHGQSPTRFPITGDSGTEGPLAMYRYGRRGQAKSFSSGTRPKIWSQRILSRENGGSCT